MLDIKKNIEPSEYQVGVIVARFQVHKLHDAHKELIDRVSLHHDKILICLGVPIIENTKSNPLDFATRKIMVQKEYPKATILPIKDNRSNETWSYNLDNIIKMAYGDKTALLYGGRDSFIPYYHGRYPTIELETKVYLSGTEIRNKVSRELLETSDFRAGIIHANYAKRVVTYPTVDIIPYSDKKQVLLAKKPKEDKWRFIGGFVDRNDESYEYAALRELHEEAGDNFNVGSVDNMEYILSHYVDDWRYAKDESGIMTILFACQYQWGRPSPSDDISELRWIDLSDLIDHENVVKFIMPEHVNMMEKFINKKGVELLNKK